MTKIRYGMIGFGGIAENRLAKEGFACDKTRFQPLNNAVLLGVTDVNPARESAARALGLGWYNNTDEMLADKSIDAVVVATNNRTHFSIASRALEAGKPVIVEKPLSPSSIDAAALVKLAADKNLSLTVDHMMVHNSLNMKAWKLVQSGAIGNVNDAVFHMQFAFGYEPNEAASWRCSRIEEMGGPIGDVASHCFYVMEYIMASKIKRVRTAYYPKMMDIKCEDGAIIKCELDNGTVMTVLVSFCDKRGCQLGTLGGLGYEIYGDKAVLRSYGTMFQLSGYADEPYQIRLELEDKDGVQMFLPENPKNIYQGIITAHADSILKGPRMTGEDGLHNVLLCEEAHKYAQQLVRV